MSARRSESPASRLAWGTVGAVLGGWAVVYTLMRLGGSTPRQAAWTSLLIGALIGLVAVAAVHLAARRLAASGRVLHRGPLQVPPPDRLTGDQRDAARLAAFACAALAAAAAVLGLGMLGTVLADASGRDLVAFGLGAWAVAVAVWLADEARQLYRGDAQGVDTVVMGAMVTAVFGGVGLSKDLIEPGQVVLIVLAGAAGALAGVTVWRLAGARGLPLGALLAVLVAVASLALPLL